MWAIGSSSVVSEGGGIFCGLGSGFGFCPVTAGLLGVKLGSSIVASSISSNSSIAELLNFFEGVI